MALPLCRAQESSLPAEQGARAQTLPFPSWQTRERDLIKKSFSWSAALTVFPGAALDQALDFPDQWRQGAAGYGVRAASRYGRFLVSRTIQTQVQLLHKEDTRYIRLGTGSVWHRTRYAMVNTFLARKPDGGRTFALSVPAGAFGGWAIASQWHPEEVRGPLRGLRTGSVGMGAQVSGNVFREFWPDIKSRLFRKRTAPRPAPPPAP